jgi:hypothetical protein
MSRVRGLLLAIAGLVVVVTAVRAWRARQASRSPLASLRALADGARAKDRRAIERYLDVSRTAESIVDEGTFAAATVAPAESSQQGETTTSLLVPVVEQSIWTTLLDPAESARYQGVADLQQRDDAAWVGVRIRLDDVDSAALVHLRMERVAGQWRVVGVEGLGPYIRAGFERRRRRAYEAEMRSDLRNLVTAQAIYFADHATYARSLGALRYDTTPGVRAEILEAGRDGWRAIARHRDASVECRVAVGSAVPPGDAAGAVKCSGGG